MLCPVFPSLQWPYSRWTCGPWKPFCFPMGCTSQQQTSCLTIMLHAFLFSSSCFLILNACLVIVGLPAQARLSSILSILHSWLWLSKQSPLLRDALHFVTPKLQTDEEALEMALLHTVETDKHEEWVNFGSLLLAMVRTAMRFRWQCVASDSLVRKR